MKKILLIALFSISSLFADITDINLTPVSSSFNLGTLPNTLFDFDGTLSFTTADNTVYSYDYVDGSSVDNFYDDIRADGFNITTNGIMSKIDNLHEIFTNVVDTRGYFNTSNSVTIQNVSDFDSSSNITIRGVEFTGYSNFYNFLDAYQAEFPDFDYELYDDNTKCIITANDNDSLNVISNFNDSIKNGSYIDYQPISYTDENGINIVNTISDVILAIANANNISISLPIDNNVTSVTINTIDELISVTSVESFSSSVISDINASYSNVNSLTQEQFNSLVDIQ